MSLRCFMLSALVTVLSVASFVPPREGAVEPAVEGVTRGSFLSGGGVLTVPLHLAPGEAGEVTVDSAGTARVKIQLVDATGSTIAAGRAETHAWTAAIPATGNAPYCVIVRNLLEAPGEVYVTLR